jgi:hypothetical protein
VSYYSFVYIAVKLSLQEGDQLVLHERTPMMHMCWGVALGF